MSLEDELPRPKDFISLKWRDESGRVKVYKLREVFSSFWKDLGKVFGFHEGLLASFEKHRGNHCEECFDDVLSEWQSNGSVPPGSYPVTWGGLIGALRDLGRMSREVVKLSSALSNRVVEEEEEGAGGEVSVRTKGCISDPSFKGFLKSDLEKSFAFLIADLVAILTESSGAFLRITTALEYVPEVPCLFEMKCIQEAKSIAEVFRYLKQFWSHTDCELLSFVVEASSCEAATARLQKFLSFRKENAERIIIHPSQPPPPSPGAETPPPSEQAPLPRAQTPPTSPHEASASDHPVVVGQHRAVIIVASVDTDVLTQKDYNDISDAVRSVLSLKKHVLVFDGTEEGSVRLKWRVHAALVGSIKSLRISDSHLQLLARHGVTRITVGHSYELCISTLHYWQRRAVYSVLGGFPLVVASERGLLSAVRVLLVNGTDVNQRTQVGHTGLLLASFSGHTDVVSTLLSAPGVLVDSADNQGYTPLHVAVHGGHTAVAALLLQYHADVNLQTKAGETALWKASFRGYTQVADLLLKAKASVDTPNKDGFTPLHVAVQEGHTAVAALLLQYHADVNLQTKAGETALWQASFEGHTQVADLLLKAKASVDTPNNDGATPLHVAAQRGHTAVAALLLQYHADVNLQDKTGQTALRNASFRGHTQVADLLLKAKASVDTPNNNGATPLYVAAQEGHTAVTALLLQYHADVNLQIKGGFTPLMIAARQGRSEVVQELLTSKADLDHQDQLGRSALMVAVQNKKRDMAALLLSAGANPDLQEEEGGRTALMSAAQAGDLEAVQILCVFGANPHIVDRVGAAAAAIASAYEHITVLIQLVEYMEQRPAPPLTEQQPPPPPTTGQPPAEPGPTTEQQQQQQPAERDVWDIIQLSNRVHSRMEAFDDEYLFQAYRDMFWKDDPEDYAPTYIAPPGHMTSRQVGSKNIHLSNIQDDDYDDLYS